MTAQTQSTRTMGVYREALAREGMRYDDAGGFDDISPATYLQIADNAVESRRLARVHLALDSAERAVLANSASARDVDDATVSAMHDARRAVLGGDWVTASARIEDALLAARL